MYIDDLVYILCLYVNLTCPSYQPSELRDILSVDDSHYSRIKHYCLRTGRHSCQQFTAKCPTLKISNLRQSLIRFRTSNHKLPIETGRYLNTLRENRLCTLCLANDIGDEYHYMFICEFFNIRMCEKDLFQNPTIKSQVLANFVSC